MTKDELIALARESKAHIESEYTITRYRITQEGVDAKGVPFDYPAIFLSICDQDGNVHDDDPYFSDDTDYDGLTDEEAETIREAIEASNAQR
jgi:hypothetical protein